MTTPKIQATTLSHLLENVGRTIAATYRDGVWLTAEVSAINRRGAHVYLELSERSASGALVAKVNGTIWANTASRILPEFEKLTGSTLVAGIKVLIRARPVYKAQYGFSLDIEAIDPAYTMGDFEARKREIRTRLHDQGLFDLQTQLAAPWSYNAVLVIAPDGAAGLGDFQSQSNRLHAHGVCEFIYAHSRFQGEGAAGEIAATIEKSLAQWIAERGVGPDAVVIIRGGGAVIDLAWLNDYELTKLICTLPYPVLTGIGHERDSTLLDEVSYAHFDTPSKVIASIEKLIVSRARESQEFWRVIKEDVTLSIHKNTNAIQGFNTSVQHGAVMHIKLAHLQTQKLLTGVKDDSLKHIANAKTTSKASLDFVSERATSHLIRTRTQITSVLDQVMQSSRHVIKEAKGKSTAHMREIMGQGPEKTLARGFTLTRSSEGKPITRANQVVPGQTLLIQFSDATLTTHTEECKS